MMSSADVPGEYAAVEPTPRPRIRPEAMFDPEDPQIKHDLTRMILQWCEDEGYHCSMRTIQDEANVKLAELEQRDSLVLRLRKTIMDGDWVETERYTRAAFKRSKPMLFSVYQQQYLELIAAQEVQKAFSLLNKRLKPLEAYARSQADFKDLCYLLTCKSVQDGVPSWEGAAVGRERLAEYFETVFELDDRAASAAAAADQTAAAAAAAKGALGAGGVGAGVLMGGGNGGGGGGGGRDAALASASGALVPRALHDSLEARAATAERRARRVPERRLWQLLRQSYAYQVEFSHFHPRVHAGRAGAPVVRSLLEDYSCPMLPNTLKATLRAHSADVKAIAYVGLEGSHAVSGGSDHTLRVWDCRDGGRLCETLVGHTARIWSVSAPPSGRLVASAGADGQVRLWARRTEQLAAEAGVEGRPEPSGHFTCAHVLGEGSHGALYTARVSDAESHCLSGGYDRKLRVYDVRAGGRLLSTLQGHESVVTTATFNQAGNLIISGSKDCKVRFWDIRTGLCIKTLSSTLIGEVSSVALASSGQSLIVSSRNNANRLWDIRSAKAVVTYKGHHNTSANFVRSTFGPNDETVIGGSEDGCVYLWGGQSGAVLHRLHGHESVVYDVDWSQRAGQLASCSHDGTVRLWMWEQDAGYEAGA